MDPSTLGLLAIGGAQNPQAFSQVMAAAGIAPSGAPTPFQYYPTLAESLQTPAAPAASPAASPDGASAAVPGVAPTAPAPTGVPLQKALGPFAGVAKPTVPQADMKAGVSSAQPAPKVAPMQHSQESQLLQLLLHRAAPPVQPTLGSLLGR